MDKCKKNTIDEKMTKNVEKQNDCEVESLLFGCDERR